jgi:ATP-binding cassette subfamily B protein IrtB
MIKRLYNLFPDKSVILKLTVLHVVLGLLQGLLLGILIPLLNCLLSPPVDLNSIKLWLITGGLGLIIYLILTVIATPIGFSASMKLATQLRNNIMNHITRLPLGLFTSENKTKYARVITADVGIISHLAVSIGAPAIVAVLVPATIILVTLFVNWKIGVLFLLIMLLSLWVLQWAARIAAEEEIKLEHAGTVIAGKAIELGQAQTVLRAAGKGVEGTDLLQQSLEEHRVIYRKGLQRAVLPFFSFIGIVTLGFISTIFLITYLFIDHSLAPAVTIVLFILAVRFLEPLGHFTELIGSLEAMDNAMARVKALLEKPSLPMAKCPVRELKNKSICLTNITFSYGQEPVIENVSFDCPEGSTTALIGASGSGKTTLIRLIARFYDVQNGGISIGGKDIRELDYDMMMSDVAIIFQDVYLFDTTIRENLLIAKPDATEAELEQAATAAQLNEMFERLPDGWDTMVGEGGLQLSGGERQRVSIARAFLKDARIILIDEAASALDPENEQAISNAITNISQDNGKTVIVIAHRPITIQAASQVIVLDKGRVIENGSPYDLLKLDGHYAKFIQQNKLRKEWKVG